MKATIEVPYFTYCDLPAKKRSYLRNRMIDRDHLRRVILVKNTREARRLAKRK